MSVSYSSYCCLLRRVTALEEGGGSTAYLAGDGMVLTVDTFSVDSSIARLAGPAFTGAPTAPTAAPATNTTQIATTAFVMSNAVTKTDDTIVPEGPAPDIDLNINGKGNGVVKTKTTEIGFRTVPSNSQTANYTTVLEDSGKAIDHPVSDNNARAFTINGSLAYPIGTCITFVNMAAAACTIPITTDTMYLAGTGTTGTRTLAQFGVATARKHAAGVWLISGTGLT